MVKAALEAHHLLFHLRRRRRLFPRKRLQRQRRREEEEEKEEKEEKKEKGIVLVQSVGVKATIDAAAHLLKKESRRAASVLKTTT